MIKKITLLILALLMVLSITACKKEVKADDLDNQPPEESGNIIPEEDEKEVEELTYVLYLRHKELPYIFSDAYSIKSNDPRIAEKSLEFFVLEELIKQKGVTDLTNPIPADTKVLSVTKQSGKVTVDLSKEFQQNMKGTQEDVKIAIAAIVNTLTTFSDIETVAILVEGSPVTNLRGVDVSGDYEFIMDFYADK